MKPFLLFVTLFSSASLLISAGCAKQKPELPVVETIDVTDITATSAMSGGIIYSDGGAQITARGVCWGTLPSSGVEDGRTIDGKATGKFTSQLTSLKAGIKYYVWAYATNSAGTAYGEEISFQWSHYIFDINHGELEMDVINMGTADYINLMTITGEMDQRDFICLRKMIKEKCLTGIILKDVKIVSYEEYQENTIPKSAFEVIVSGPYSISNNHLKEIVLPDNIVSIGDKAFKGCDGLSGTIIIPKDVVYIGEYAFAGCDGLHGIKVSWDTPIEYTTGMFPTDKPVYVPSSSRADYKTAPGWKEHIIIGY